MNLDSTVNNPDGAPINDLRFEDATFKAFFKKHYPPLCIYCKLKYGFDMDLAEDLVNASFIKLWEARQAIARDISPKSYLYKILDNLSLNTLRHEKVKQRHAAYLRLTTKDISETSFDSIDFKQLSSAIDAAILELPEQMRIIFELRKFEDLKYAEIASRLNISVKTVDTQMSRAMTKLREKLSGFLVVLIVLIFNLFLKK